MLNGTLEPIGGAAWLIQLQINNNRFQGTVSNGLMVNMKVRAGPASWPCMQLSL